MTIAFIIGYSGEDAPRMCTRSVAGVVETEGKKDYFVDDMLRVRRDGLSMLPITDKYGYSKRVY
jgi:hypothetical protein